MFPLRIEVNWANDWGVVIVEYSLEATFKIPLTFQARFPKQ